MPWQRRRLALAFGCLLVSAPVAAPRAQSQATVPLPTAIGVQDDSLRQLFTPAMFPTGTFTVYRSAEPIGRLAARLKALDPSPVPGAWAVDRAGVFDAFGAEGPYDKGRLARLFRGALPSVARGSLQTAVGRLAIALISPYPDPSLSSLHAGTMAIVTKLPVQPVRGQR